MSALLHIYHGSREVINKPLYGGGRKHNDYGLGFYCTEDEDVAKEWACSPISDGFSNHYTLDTSLLYILNLNGDGYNVLNWIATLVENRIFNAHSPIAGRAKRYLKDNFSVNINAYDVIVGYRADDAYYDFATAFLNNTITVEQLARAMQLGKLGEQVVIKSQLAFDNLKFKGFEIASRDIYYPIRKTRFDKAEHDFRRICEETADGMYMIDIIREGVGNDDPRIP